MKTFGEFYKRLGLTEYPFGAFTSESELSRQAELFIGTSLYSPIVETFASGSSLVLSGDRGTGKTAILYDFIRRIRSNKTLLAQVDDYSALKEGFSSRDLYIFLTEKLADALFVALPNAPVKHSRLSKQDRVLLSYYLARYTAPTTKRLLEQRLFELQLKPIARVGAFLYRFTRVPFNVGANATAHFVGDVVARSIGAAPTDASWREYFPEIGAAVDADFADAEGTFASLCRLAGISRKVGFEKIVMILDKVDEDPRFGNAAEDIAEFIGPLLTDNKILLERSLQMVVSLWVIPLNMLRDRVRTQKINCPVIHWGPEDLKNALDRRLAVFSDGVVKAASELFADDVVDDDVSEIIALSNRNPRDLWHVMDHVLRAQYKYDPSAVKICRSAVKNGLNAFVREFNFYEYYPRKSNARKNSMDVYAYIKHLLRLEGAEFTKNQLNERAGTGSSTQNYVVAMENMGLVEATGSSGGSTTYSIRDPKVVYAIQHGIDIARSA